MYDLNASDDSLVNRIPATILLSILERANNYLKKDAFESFRIVALRECKKAVCLDATKFEVLCGCGYGNDEDNPSKWLTISYETKGFRDAFNVSQIQSEEMNFPNYLAEHSEDRIYLK
jgi:hypothetical protein